MKVVIEMRVDAFNKVSQLYQTNSSKKVASSNKFGEADKLEISQFGRDYQIAKQAVSNTPDVRQDKIDAIKSSLASGNYDVSSKEVADKLVDSYFESLV